MRATIITGLVLLLAAVTACSSDDGEGTPTPEVQAGGKAGLAACTAPADTAVSAVAAGLNAGDAVSLRGAQAMQNTDGSWLLAADIEGDGLDAADDILIWNVGADLAAPGPFIAANEMAREHSRWGASVEGVDVDPSQADILAGCVALALGD